VIAAVLEANPHLALMPPVLSAGLLIELLICLCRSKRL